MKLKIWSKCFCFLGDNTDILVDEIFYSPVHQNSEVKTPGAHSNLNVLWYGHAFVP